MNEIHFLAGWSKSLAKLPDETAVYVVFGCSERPNEPEKVFTDHSAALLWLARLGKDSIDYEVKPYTVFHTMMSDITYLTRGVSTRSHQIRSLKPLPSDRELAEA